MAHADGFTAEWFGFLAARELGYWKDENLDVQLVATDGSGPAVEQLAAGNLDAAIPSMTSAIEAAGTGIGLVNVYTYSYGAIFGVWGVGPHPATSVADLKGKTIGNTEAGGGEVAFLDVTLRNAGLDPVTDVTLVVIGDGGATTIAAIDTGKVDAYAAAYNDIFSMQVQGVAFNDLTPPLFKDWTARGIMTTPAFLASNSDALGRLARGVAKGTLFCETNPEACKKMMQKAVPQQWEVGKTGESQGSLRYALGLKQVMPRTATFGEHGTAAMQAEVDAVAQSVGAAFKPVDLGTFLNSSILPEANNFDQNAVIEQAKAYTGN
jgi:ABC-type nitrate/sulfonate/bicarbonate transport system substrate-binding protein